MSSHIPYSPSYSDQAEAHRNKARAARERRAARVAAKKETLTAEPVAVVKTVEAAIPTEAKKEAKKVGKK